VKPIDFIRKALPSLFKASAPRSYPGVNLGAGSSSAALVTVTDALVVPGKGKGKGGGRGKGGEDGGRGGGKPGAARGAATWSAAPPRLSCPTLLRPVLSRIGGLRARPHKASSRG
jgi:hypothetical protein